MSTTVPFVPGVFRLPVLFVNVYLVREPGQPGVLVDTGLPWFAGRVRRWVEARLGGPPSAIVLTHGHFDHAGNAEELAGQWGVPVYAHPLELPFLTGRSDYPPNDPTVGGAIGLLARSFPNHGFDLRRSVQPLPDDGSVPGLPGWRWLPAPGHTAGHVALFREADRTLLAGDALATLDMRSPLSLITQRRDLSLPPAPFTTDWQAARTSVASLAELRPRAVAAGHGRPVQGRRTAAELVRLARIFTPPRKGRYVLRPARSNAQGIIELPPPVDDPLPKQLLLAGLAAGALFALVQTLRARSKQPRLARRGDRRRKR
jgi:glyoxylase-like metal-dependent hydrolase (beta-lactamase superfamily II)